MNIVPKLNLNKHPHAMDNNSIIYAENMMVSKDNTILQNENVCDFNYDILNGLSEKYTNGVNIVYALPCNTEIIFFIRPNNTDTVLDILRYNEVIKEAKIVVENFPYHNGVLLGTFTYNKNKLIIAISEYDGDEDVPLQTIDIGSWEDDINQELEKLPLTPEVKLPYVTNEYVNGKFYKGWYSTYIRYKINDNDYTQWYSIGIPFVLDAINNQTVVKVMTTTATSETDNNFKFSGFIDNFNSNDDYSKDTVKITFDGLDNRYSFYQIAVIKKTITSTNSYATNDINIKTQNLIIDSSLFKEFNTNELLKTYYNYYNVKTLDTINNRLYIANYKEINNILNVNADNVAKINLKLQVSKLQIHNDIVSSATLFNNTFTKDNKTTYTSIDEKGIISFKEYCKQSNIIYLQKVANATDDSLISFMYINGTISEEVPLHTLKIEVMDDEDLTGHYVYSNIYGNSKRLYAAGNNTMIFINNEKIFDNKFILSLLKNYKCSSTEFNSSYITQDYRNVIKNNTLLAGEVYNFYIHYVDKYGHSTDGYKISYKNPIKIILNEQEISILENIDINDIVPVLFLYGSQYYKVLVKANSLCIDENSFITDTNGNLYIFNASNGASLFNCDVQYTGFDNLTNDVINLVYSYYSINNTDIWANIIENYTNNEITNSASDKIDFTFLPFINSNNEILYRVPNIPSICGKVINLIKLFGNNISIPSNYVGWFISCEKLENRKKINGFINLNKTLKGNVYFNSEKREINVYTDEINIKENINLSANKIRLIPYSIQKGISNVGEKNKISNYNYFFDETTISSDEYLFYKEYLIQDIKVLWADTVDNYNRSSHLNIVLNSFPDIVKAHNNDDDVNFIYCELYSTSRNLYTNENKILYRITNIYNRNINNEKFEAIEVISGNISFDTAIVYDYRGVMVDETYKKLIPFDEKKENNNDFLTYAISFFNFPNYSSYIKELKIYNNEPNLKIVPYWLSTDDKSNTRYIDTKIVIPMNSLDLWKNDFIIDRNIKTYLPFNKNFIDNFPNAIRRSNVMQDESDSNAWRWFDTEEYRNIHENKGNIVKLVGIGKYFIVHTEHSMFLFNTTDTIKSDEGGIQLASTDIMNLSYQEVITGKLGYGGIQKETHGIVGSFGYIWYDESDKRFYNYDNKSISTIDDDIRNYIKFINIDNLIFGDDKERNRLFIKLNDLVVLSYNYVLKKFISFHNDNTFKPQSVANWPVTDIKFFSTKNKLYISNGIVKRFGEILDRPTYITVYNITNFVEDTYSKSSISIINNYNYELMKYIDNIIYKVNKVKAVTDYTEYPVEEKHTLYAADYITIYSELCNTGRLKIDTTNNLNSPDNYMTPYWRFGNWHFNALRNRLKDEISADEKSKIFGNWFVVKFEFDTNDKVEIESLECKTSIAEY